MNLGVKAIGVNEIGAKYDALAGRHLDARPVFSDITNELIKGEAKLFSTARGWPPDRLETLKAKARRGEDPRPLHATGRGERALTERNAEGQKLEIERDRMAFGIDAHGPAFYMRFQAKYGRNPLVSRGIVSRVAKPRLREFLTGG